MTMFVKCKTVDCDNEIHNSHIRCASCRENKKGAIQGRVTKEVEGEFTYQ